MLLQCRWPLMPTYIYIHLHTSQLQIMACGRDVILSLYRNLIQESKKWSSYSYRTYALRKIRYEFRENRALQDQQRIKQQYEKGLEALAMIKRQVIIGNLYGTRPLIIETQDTAKRNSAKQ